MSRPPARLRFARAVVGSMVIVGTAGTCASCMRFSPFQVELSTEEREHTAKNLAKLASRPRGPASPEAPLTLAFLADTHDTTRSAPPLATARHFEDTCAR
jgi:hypothetical protein